jgi:hypothetical protein
MILKKATIIFSLCICAVTAGCGGSSSSSSSNTSVILAVVPGPWSGTYALNGGSNIPVSGTVASGGFGYFADNQGNVFLIQNVPEQSPFTTTVIGTAAPGQTFSNGYNVNTFSTTGTYTSTATSTTMQASLSGIDPTTGASTGLKGTYTLNTDFPFTGTASIASLQGQLNGYYIGKSSTSVDFTIKADGTFSGNDGNGCSISGSLVQQGPDTNVFFVNYHAGGAGCPGVMNGLAYESSKDTFGVFGGANGTYLYMGVFGLSIAYTAELKL